VGVGVRVSFVFIMHVLSCIIHSIVLNIHTLLFVCKSDNWVAKE